MFCGGETRTRTASTYSRHESKAPEVATIKPNDNTPRLPLASPPPFFLRCKQGADFSPGQCTAQLSWRLGQSGIFGRIAPSRRTSAAMWRDGYIILKS